MTTGSEARSALDEIERRRRQVIEEIGLPTWYWWGLAAGWVVLGFLTDLHHPWLTTVATVAFGAGHASVAQAVIGGRRRTRHLSVRGDVAGCHVPLYVIAALIGLAGVTVAASLLAMADDARHPVTIASIGVALVILQGGPRLMVAVRHRATRATPALGSARPA